MPRLVTKFKYLKPNRKVSAGGYAKYIATRDGVDKIDDTQKFAPATTKQKNLIEKIIKDFPDCKEMFEYADYLEKLNMGTASDFISRAIEDNAYEIEGRKSYANILLPVPVPKDLVLMVCSQMMAYRFSCQRYLKNLTITKGIFGLQLFQFAEKMLNGLALTRVLDGEICYEHRQQLLLKT